MRNSLKRLLIIDDERDLLQMLAMMLESARHFETSVAANGEEGIKKACSLKPDLILLDTVMPNMDGWQVLRQLRLNPKTKDIPVVMMTAGEGQKMAARVRAEGGSAMVQKPFEDEDLLTILHFASSSLAATHGTRVRS